MSYAGLMSAVPTTPIHERDNRRVAGPALCEEDPRRVSLSRPSLTDSSDSIAIVAVIRPPLSVEAISRQMTRARRLLTIFTLCHKYVCSRHGGGLGQPAFITIHCFADHRNSGADVPSRALTTLAEFRSDRHSATLLNFSTGLA